MTLNLDKLEELAKAATQGPWKSDSLNNVRHRSGIVLHSTIAYIEPRAADSAFIAAVNPDVVLELIAELRKARKERNWIARRAVCIHDACARPGKCDGHPPYAAKCVKCWLEAAKEATCPKN